MSHLERYKKVDILVEPSKEQVFEYMEKCEPFLIKKCAKNWVALNKWNDEFLKAHYGHHPLRIHRTSDKHNAQMMPFGEFIDYMKSADETDPFYASSWEFSHDYRELVEDYDVPSYFDCMIRERLPDELLHGDAKMLLLRWMYIGPKNSGSLLHLDVCGTHAWNAVISGKKEWTFYGPDQSAYLYDGAVDSFEPDLEKHPLFEQAIGYYAEQEAGDVIFTPCTHWHQVKNVEAGISITENFINHTNLSHVRTALNEDEDISEDQAQFITELLPEILTA
ncbi:hypothetical protein PULV_a3984 [Pseudoalteromonas ulvae UL12]|uniref:cupin-like domain-containing protein n=1 Tax=Pseudoalteromonas ulvae TaxID=107327 RepID=UPI0019EB59E7|nr:cupin-like domain-containing protein [Pseudoalteromonas ulvae]MBE0362176.1 hypothetical protein [Pseudoalteromonas ulvae UL12]